MIVDDPIRAANTRAWIALSMANPPHRRHRQRRAPHHKPLGRNGEAGEIGEIGGQRPEPFVAHALVDEMAQRLDILVSQELGKLVAALQRQHGGDRVEFFGPALDSGQ